MLAKDHQITSACVVLDSLIMLPVIGISNPISGFTTVGLITGVIIGAIVPDIDTKSSTISRFIKIPVYKLLRHRGGLTHSLWGIAGFSLLMLLISQSIFKLSIPSWTSIIFTSLLGLVIGYTLHVIEDYFSLDAVRWLPPFSSYDEWYYQHTGRLAPKPCFYRKRFGKKIPARHVWGVGYRVGGTGERVIVWLIVLITILLLLWYFHLFSFAVK